MCKTNNGSYRKRHHKRWIHPQGFRKSSTGS